MKATCRMLPKIDPRHSAPVAKTLHQQLMPLLVLLGLLSLATQSAFAQANPPLGFGNNFFVTGDYVVAGAYNMTQKFTTINGVSYAVGTINVPDVNPKGVPNPGITGAKSVPPGAQIVAALLYWQTVEKVGAVGSGQNGYFRPLLSGGPAAPGYLISGTNLTSPGNPTVSWSSGGCSGGSTGKILRTYRADVGGGLPLDPNGNPTANGSFEVRLPSVGNSTPLTLGATLVVIYRLPTGANGPNVPLNSIVIYDGDFGQSTGQLTMTQQLKGFYDADHSTVTRLTHIVGSGQSNKFQTVYLGSANPLIKLPAPYGNNLPYFPGWYGTWDNPTWTFTSGSPLAEDSSSATTQVIPSPSNQGCVSWGAVIVSTTVKNGDNDGILDSWKTNHGYCDYSVNPSCTGSSDAGWVDLTGAAKGQKDVFLQYDYMCSSVTGPGRCDSNIAKDSLSAVAAASGGNTTYTGTISHQLSAGTHVGIAGFTKPANEGQFTVVSSSSTQLVVNNPNGVAETQPGVATYAIPGDPNYSFDPRLATDPFDGRTAVEKVVASYDNENGSSSHHIPIVLHAIPGNAIKENQPNISCTSSDPVSTCTFPNELGTVGFREGLAQIKNTNIETTTGVIGNCTPGPGDLTCQPVFQHGKKDSYHYALFSHGVGLPNWFLSDGSIQSVQQTGTTVKFTTKLPHGISQILAQPNYATATDMACPLGRVTVVFAVTNPNLNGTYCVLSMPAPTATTFSISVGGTPTTTTVSYTSKTDPNLGVANGQVTSMSGFSDVGGENLVISLGYGGWGPPNNPFVDGNQWQDKAGTFMHELGHNMFLTHGGTLYNSLGNSPPDYTPTFEVNCKPNLQSNMNYLFQFDLLQVPSQTNPDGTPLMAVDYSEETLPTLVESSPQTGVLSSAFYAKTSWFELLSHAGSGSVMPSHCDFTPLLSTDQPTVAVPQSPVSDFGWSSASGLDINFNGTPNPGVPAGDTMHGHDEWDGTPALGEVGPAPGVDLLQISALGTISAVGLGGEEGGLHGGGGGLHGGGGGLHGGGGGLHGGGGGLHGGGGAEITHEQACSYARPPQNLIAQEEASPRHIDLSWLAPTVCQPVNYNIYRSAGGTFSQIGSVPGSQTTFQDTTATCSPGGYSYRVTAVINNGTPPPPTLESVPSNIVSTGQNGEPLTGCYLPPAFSSPAAGSSPLQGSAVPIIWTVQDASNKNGVTFANNPGSNTLVAIGPFSDDMVCVPGSVPANTPRTTISSAGAGITFSSGTNQFSFSWNTAQGFNGTPAAAFPQGCYLLEDDLDSGQPTLGGKPASAFQVQLYLSDINESVQVSTTSLSNATEGGAYSQTLQESGGVLPVSWTFTGTLPPGLTLDSASGKISGTPTQGGTYTFTVKATDSIGDVGTQTLTLLVIGFGPTGSLNTARWAHTATLLNSGKVLVTGGTDVNGRTLATAELYDPVARTFSATGSMQVARSSHTATLLNDGRVLVTGGGSTSEIYDPTSGTFTSTASMSESRLGSTATLLQDGTVLVAGGSNDGTAEIYNPANGVFGTPINMNAARSYHTATLLSSGQVLLAGGEDSSSANVPTLASAEIYDPASQTFAATGSLTTSRELHTATLLVGSVYAIGGRSGSSAGYTFLNSAESFTGSGFSVLANTLNTARTTHTATLLQNGSVLIAGGFGSGGALPSAELFNSGTQGFSVTPSLETGRYFHTATLLNDGTVLVTGGIKSAALSSAELYYAAPAAH
jgi:hypothetical protein